MKEKPDRYTASGLIEGQFEPGSRGRVLLNKRGINRKREMDRIESEELLKAFKKIIALYGTNHRFNASDICRMHREWLGDVYAWAGKYRQVNLSKGEFTFASAISVPRLMAEFEQLYLAVYTPCRNVARHQLSLPLAIVHVELLLIHPFREGNGRLARMLAVLMAFTQGCRHLISVCSGGKSERAILVRFDQGCIGIMSQ